MATGRGRLERGEVVRKLIHIAFGLLLALIYELLKPPFGLFALSLGLALSVVYDVLRVRARYSTPFQSLVVMVARGKELSTIGGQTYFFAGALTAALLFNPEAVVTAIGVTALSDGVSSLVGRRIGRHRFKKISLEGVLAGLIVGWLFTLLYTNSTILSLFVLPGIVAAELSSIYFNDNLTYPVLVALMTEIARGVFG